jgi:hypothetical protein
MEKEEACANTQQKRRKTGENYYDNATATTRLAIPPLRSRLRETEGGAERGGTERGGTEREEKGEEDT